MDFYSASSLKQQSAGRHVAPLGTHFPDSEPTSICSFSLMLHSGEATNTNYIVFGLTRSGLEPTIYRTQDEHANHYTTDAVDIFSINIKNVLKFKHDIFHIGLLIISQPISHLGFAFGRYGSLLIITRQIWKKSCFKGMQAVNSIYLLNHIFITFFQFKSMTKHYF